MTIKNLVNVVEGMIEVYKTTEIKCCVGDGDCFRCEHFGKGEEEGICSGKWWSEEHEETLFKGFIKDVPYNLANKKVVSIRAEHIKPFYKPRKAYTLIKIEVQGDTE